MHHYCIQFHFSNLRSLIFKICHKTLTLHKLKWQSQIANFLLTTKLIFNKINQLIIQ